MCLCVTIPLVTNWKKHEIGVRPTLKDMKRNLQRFATHKKGRFTGTNEKLRSPADRLVHTCRIAAQMKKKQSHVQACEDDIMDTIR